jgi:hypothetical protein
MLKFVRLLEQVTQDKFSEQVVVAVCLVVRFLHRGDGGAE